MYESQKVFIESHSIEIPDNCPICKGICELGSGTRKPTLPKRSSGTKSDKKEARKELMNSTYFFLRICYKLKLIDEIELREKCEQIGTSVDLNDLR